MPMVTRPPVCSTCATTHRAGRTQRKEQLLQNDPMNCELSERKGTSRRRADTSPFPVSSEASPCGWWPATHGLEQETPGGLFSPYGMYSPGLALPGLGVYAPFNRPNPQACRSTNDAVTDITHEPMKVSMHHLAMGTEGDKLPPGGHILCCSGEGGEFDSPCTVASTHSTVPGWTTDGYAVDGNTTIIRNTNISNAADDSACHANESAPHVLAVDTEKKMVPAGDYMTDAWALPPPPSPFPVSSEAPMKVSMDHHLAMGTEGNKAGGHTFVGPAREVSLVARLTVASTHSTPPRWTTDAASTATPPSSGTPSSGTPPTTPHDMPMSQNLMYWPSTQKQTMVLPGDYMTDAWALPPPPPPLPVSAGAIPCTWWPVTDGLEQETPGGLLSPYGMCPPGLALPGLGVSAPFNRPNPQACRNTSGAVTDITPRADMPPSRGSKNHAIGQCRPCRNFFKPGGCAQGAMCNFCHNSHDVSKLISMTLLDNQKRGGPQKGKWPATFSKSICEAPT
eukprot:NODE_4146_length_1930_cov_8.556295.p1 GENE.NODE_4146_length_1930_cov_8.556295~~NODE_4146_length_1930_cov_8.556295.p1  ORF type:complete len:508 (+),score=15.58 NODE_4146_length_1930_cov_8.556295:127-1650(+)